MDEDNTAKSLTASFECNQHFVDMLILLLGLDFIVNLVFLFSLAFDSNCKHGQRCIVKKRCVMSLCICICVRVRLCLRVFERIRGDSSFIYVLEFSFVCICSSSVQHCSAN